MRSSGTTASEFTWQLQRPLGTVVSGSPFKVIGCGSVRWTMTAAPEAGHARALPGCVAADGDQ